MIEFIDDPEPWHPTTSGERLLFLLLANHKEARYLAGALFETGLRFGRRYGDWSNFLVGASLLHLQQRLIRLADDVRYVFPTNRDDQLRELRARTCDVIQLTPIEYSANFGDLIEEILVSAEQMHRVPGPGLRKLVFRAGPHHCYSCGRLFGAVFEDAPDGLQATADHVWPRALGGDSNESNLLPACEQCNSAKSDLATWHTAWIQPVVFSDADDQDDLPPPVPRKVQMALHMRAAMAYARANGTTLRDAFLTIGPRDRPAKIDQDQGYDFFNMRVHDEGRTMVKWIPG
ncbi:HNH endonuclease [Agrobacterium sp. LAD9]|uniref:HNH endonuclease n=1 Tax=Agrobacterium sp. LAD9 TaxID=2055153 RepID=UPI000D1EC44E|nr:HNH endonuclease [Agrobacterium sp. LAD9]